MSALSPRMFFLLDEACKPIVQAFPDYGPYLVGTAAEGKTYRDVDVRLILEDASYDEIADVMTAPGMAFLGLAIGEYLTSRTGLPIDFQIQRATEANELHSRERGGTCRNPLGRRTLGNYEGDAPAGHVPPEVEPKSLADVLGLTEEQRQEHERRLAESFGRIRESERQAAIKTQGLVIGAVPPETTEEKP